MRSERRGPTLTPVPIRFSDVALAVTVTVALFVTGSAFYDLGRRLPPPRPVSSEPVEALGPPPTGALAAPHVVRSTGL